MNTWQQIGRKPSVVTRSRLSGCAGTAPTAPHSAEPGRRARWAADSLRRGRDMTMFVVVAVGASGFTGCTRTVPMSLFQIVDYRTSGVTDHYRETFAESYYKMDGHGNVDVVMRRSTAEQDAPEKSLTQILHIRTIWRSIPGRTVSHPTQLNATVTYCLLSGRVGTAYEGAGSVLFKPKRNGSVIGTLDFALLRPTRRRSSDQPMFARAELSGKFHATHDPRRVIQLINEMNRLFGPLPREFAAPDGVR